MKSKITLALMVMIALGFFNASLKASDEFDKAMLKAKKNLKNAMWKNDESGILKARGEFERILQLKEDVWLVEYYLALADYGLATGAQIKQDLALLKKYTEAGIDQINKSIDNNPEFADSYVLLEALHFNRWSYEQDKMQEIITATSSADESAAKLEKKNPRLLMLNGIASFYTPEAFGGGVKAALPKLEESVSIFKTRKELKETYPDWGHDLALGYMALALMKRDDDGDQKKALEYIEEAKKLYPDSGFITVYVEDEYKKANMK